MNQIDEKLKKEIYEYNNIFLETEKLRTEVALLYEKKEEEKKLYMKPLYDMLLELKIDGITDIGVIQNYSHLLLKIYGESFNVVFQCNEKKIEYNILKQEFDDYLEIYSPKHLITFYSYEEVIIYFIKIVKEKLLEDNINIKKILNSK